MRVRRPGRGRPRGAAVERDDRPPDKHSAQRRQRIVGDLTGPHQIPQRGQQLGIGGVAAAARSWLQKLAPWDARWARIASWQSPARRLGNVERGVEQRELIGEVQPDAPVARTDGSCTDPHDVAGGAQLVEIGSPIRAQARCEQLRLQRRRDQGRPLQLPQHLDQRIEPAPLARDAVPCLDETGVGLGLDGLDLAAQRGQRAPTQLPKHLGIAVLAAHPTGPELAVDDATLRLQRSERTDDPFERRGQAMGDVGLR